MGRYNLAIFGKGDLYLGVEGIKSFFPKSYGDPLENKENELTLGYKKLIPLEIEVFQLSWTFIKKCILIFLKYNKEKILVYYFLFEKNLI